MFSSTVNLLIKFHMIIFNIIQVSYVIVRANQRLLEIAPEVFGDFILIIGCARPLFLVQLATPSTLQSKVCYKSNIIEAQVEKSTTFNTDSNSTGYVAPITRGGMLSMSWCCGVASIINLLRARSYGKSLLRKSNKKRSNIT